MNSGLIFFIAFVLLLGMGLFAFVSRQKSRVMTLNKTKIQAKWLKIEQSLIQGNQPSYHLAILEADKFLDFILRAGRFSGETMGDRLRSAEKHFKNPNAVWAAHKIRNQIAHEPDFEINYGQAMKAMLQFRGALKDLGVL
ncbi:hypothetical protein FWH09_02365 [Candidatus Saccharibacteria bacterium]|nr:hypothetical protein [Candidatus Saccharibacteria bacterium]